MKIYRGNDGDTEPVEMECEEFGYPHNTTCGEEMYDNTHFKTEQEAWDSILKSVKAGVELVGRDIVLAENYLRGTEKMAAEIAKSFAEANGKYEIWKMKLEGGE